MIRKGISSYETNPASFMILLMAGIALAILNFSLPIIIKNAAAQPSIIRKPNLKVESVVSGLPSPTCPTFIEIESLYNVYTTYDIYKSTFNGG